MKLSTKSRYGTRAIAEIARWYPHRAVKRKQIAGSQQISDSYLENILISLKANGLIYTLRGAHGGYQLTRPPEEITVLEVVEALEGPLAPVPCVVPTYTCKLDNSCLSKSIWKEMYEGIRSVLSRYTLRDLARQNNDELFQDFMI